MKIDANCITPRLWQGSNPPQGPALRALGFNTLALCAREHQYPSEMYPGLRVLKVPMDDSAWVPVEEAQAAARVLADEHRVGRKILVVCNMGLNRSGLVTALTLWHLSGRPGVECLWQVQSRREGALFNHEFSTYLYMLPPKGKLRAA